MRTRFRKPLLYPLSYGGRATLCPPVRRGRIARVSDATAIADLLHEAGDSGGRMEEAISEIYYELE